MQNVKLAELSETKRENIAKKNSQPWNKQQEQIKSETHRGINEFKKIYQPRT
jgi:hypothetical protein